MSVKYYTHFLMQERKAGVLAGGLSPVASPEPEQGLSEFRGVVEVNRKLPRGDYREAAVVLARNFECDAGDIRILQWSRLH